jgi:hypothetical protein
MSTTEELPRRHYPAPLAVVNELSPRLKKSVEQSSFVKYKLDDSYIGVHNVSVQDRMRVMDRFNLHNPHAQEECTFLNLPSNRLHLHSLKDVMYLSGGLVGVRFESDELKQTSELCNQLAVLWADIDKLYKGMSSIERKTILSTSAVVVTAEATLDTNPDAILDVKVDNVTKFHQLCDQYLEIIKDLQRMVLKKQGQIDVNEAGIRGESFCNLSLLWWWWWWCFYLC